MRIGYIVSRYPGVSHTFIQREVLGLRKLGWTIDTISVRRAPVEHLLTETDRAEAAGTFVLVPPTMFGLAAAVVRPLAMSPRRFVGAARCAWRVHRPGVRGMLWGLFYFVEALLLHRYCRRKKIRHLHAHFANVASDVAMIASRLNGGSFSYTMHGPTEFFDIAEHRLAEKTRAAALVVCISDFARSQLMSLVPPAHWGKLHVVHCGVDPAQFKGERAAGVRVAEGGAPKQILCIARLAPVKGHAILLQALATLRAKGRNVAATFAGDGPLRGELTRLADSLGLGAHVTFLGNVGQDAVASLYASADIFVLPSFAEGVPVVLMEAMAAGCPVVATRIAGISELVDEGRTGILVPPGRTDRLAAAIEEVLGDPAGARGMAGAAREKVEGEFNLEKVAGELGRIFRENIGATDLSGDFSAKHAQRPLPGSCPTGHGTLAHGTRVFSAEEGAVR